LHEILILHIYHYYHCSHY